MLSMWNTGLESGDGMGAKSGPALTGTCVIMCDGVVWRLVVLDVTCD
jgi:hypothetical protein